MATENEVKQYLFDCLSEQDNEILGRWINDIKAGDLPDNGDSLIVKIQLSPARYNGAIKDCINLQKGASRLLNS